MVTQPKWHSDRYNVLTNRDACRKAYATAGERFELPAPTQRCLGNLELASPQVDRASNSMVVAGYQSSHRNLFASCRSPILPRASQMYVNSCHLILSSA